MQLEQMVFGPVQLNSSILLCFHLLDSCLHNVTSRQLLGLHASVFHSVPHAAVHLVRFAGTYRRAVFHTHCYLNKLHVSCCYQWWIFWVLPTVFFLSSQQKSWFLFGFVGSLFIAVAGWTTSKQLTVNRLRASWPPAALELVTCIQPQKTAFLLGCLVLSFPFLSNTKRKNTPFFFFISNYRSFLA